MATREYFLKEAKKRIGKKGHDLFEIYGCRTHWCMMQVYYLIHDVCEIDIPKTYSCSVFKNTGFAKERLNHDYKTAEVADIIFFENNGSRADGPDHVGLVIENTGSTIKVLEGNTNGVYGDWYNTSTTNVFEYPYSYSGFDCIIDMSSFFTINNNNLINKEENNNVISENFTMTFRTLKKGMKGEDVKRIQRLLFADGYSVGNCGDDGDFGPDTEKAVLRYQFDHKLTKDGIVGEKTFKSLWGC